MTRTAVITVDIPPTLELGPLTLAWHGITTAAGIGLGLWLAARYARRRGLSVDQVAGAGIAMAVAGLAGARVFFLAVNDPAALLRPGDWLGGNGFAIYGGVVAGTLAAALYVRRHRLDLRYLDALAFGFPLGLALGRVGDLINGEHYGPASSAPWAVRHPHPEALVPDPSVAYHDGGLYEIALGLMLMLAVWWLRDRLRRPGDLLWTVLGLYAVGRFAMFFYRSDSETVVLGLVEAQLASLGLVAAAALGAAWRVRGARSVVVAVAAVGLGALALVGCTSSSEPAPEESAVREIKPVRIPDRYAGDVEDLCRRSAVPLLALPPSPAQRDPTIQVRRAFPRVVLLRDSLRKLNTPPEARPARRRLLAALERQLRAMQAVLHPEPGTSLSEPGAARRLEILSRANLALHRVFDETRLVDCAHRPPPEPGRR